MALFTGYVRVEQRNAHLAGAVRLMSVEGRDGPVSKALLTAISNTRKGNADNRGEEATVIQWTLWGKQAEAAALYLVKGSHVNGVAGCRTTTTSVKTRRSTRWLPRPRRSTTWTARRKAKRCGPSRGLRLVKVRGTTRARRTSGKASLPRTKPWAVVRPSQRAIARPKTCRSEQAGRGALRLALHCQQRHHFAQLRTHQSKFNLKESTWTPSLGRFA